MKKKTLSWSSDSTDSKKNSDCATKRRKTNSWLRRKPIKSVIKGSSRSKNEPSKKQKKGGSVRDAADLKTELMNFQEHRNNLSPNQK